jgi:gluconolactonase
MTYTTLDSRFDACTVAGGMAEQLWTGGKWVEGPAWFDEGYLLWSDIPNDRILRWDATGVTTFRQPSGKANGNTVDREGRLVTCEGNGRRITRTEGDGQITILTESFQGKLYNAPNDVVVKSDGSVWFTDPRYGDGEPELSGCHVYRLDPATGHVRQMTSDMVMPNGLAFSLDETELFVVDTGSTSEPDGPNHIRRFQVGPGNWLIGGAVFADNAAKSFDGIRFDSESRLWCGAEDGVHCYVMDGTLIGKIALPERAANLTFGPKGWLYITATTSLYRVPVNAQRP